jgi:multicomponent Na+:H+ antiporter subunit E
MTVRSGHRPPGHHPVAAHRNKTVSLMNPPDPAIHSRVSSLGWRAVLLVAIWVVLAGGWPTTDGPLVAALIAAALLTSCRLCPPAPIGLRPWQVVRFIPWFLGQSLIGGLDVAKRALSPRMPLQPGFVAVPLHVPPGPARITLVWILSLLPGTAAVHLQESKLTVHVLDREIHTVEKLSSLERRVSALFKSP